MSQAITAVPASYTGQIIQYVQDFLFDPLIPRIVNAAAIPLSILATFRLQPYLILDPSTTIIGIGCAILVNTVVLKYLHSVIQDYWVNYWAANYLVPSETPEQAPAATTPATPQSTAVETPLASATAAYKASQTALDNATNRVKRAHIQLESVDQGQEAHILRLRLAVYEKKRALIHYAETMRGLIDELINHQKVLEPYGLDIQELIRAVPEEIAAKDSPQELIDAKKILNIDLTELCERLTTIFRETREQLSATQGPNYIDPQHRLSQEVLQEDELKLERVGTRLEENQVKTAKIQAKEQEQVRTQTAKRRDLTALAPSQQASADDEANSALIIAQGAREAAQQKLGNKESEKLRRLEEIRKLENHGVPRKGEHAADSPANELFKFESEVGLMKLRTEHQKIIDATTDATEVDQILAKLNLALEPFRTRLNTVGLERIQLLKTWAKKFGELSDKAAKKPASLQQNPLFEFFSDVHRKIVNKRELTAEEKVKYATYYTKLAQVYTALVAHAAKPTSNYPKVLDEDRHQESMPTIEPLDIEKTEGEHEQSLIDYQRTAEARINAEASLILPFEEVLAAIMQDKLKGTIETSDIALKISKHASLLGAMEYDTYTLAIRRAQDEIFQLREKRSRAVNLLQQIEKELKIRQGEIEVLKDSLALFETKEIIPLKAEVAQATDALVTIEVKIASLRDDITKIDDVLLRMATEKRAAALDVERNLKEQLRLTNRIDLARKAISLAPIMDPVGKISRMRGEGNASITVIVSGYQQAETLRRDAETERPRETWSALEELRLAHVEKEEKAEAEREAFKILALEQAKLFAQEIKTLRGSRHQSIVSHAETVQRLYDPKIRWLTGAASTAEAGSSAVQRSDLQTSSLVILEKKIKIAAAKIKMNAFAFANGVLQGSPIALQVDQARLRLAEHRLKRHRLEEKWKTSEGGSAINVGEELIELIQSEQLLTFHYFALKLSRDAKKDTNHAVKANFAILNLILDIIHIKSSNLDIENRKKFNIIQGIKDLFEESMATEEAIQFNEWAYGKPQQPVGGYTIVGAVRAALGRRDQSDKPVTKNPFVEKLVAALDLDGQKMEANANPSSLKLTNFLEEVDNRSRQFHAEKERVISTKTYTAMLIGSKIALTQLSLNQPLSSEKQFKGRFAELYQPARREYQRSKYAAKIQYATAMKSLTIEKSPYKEAMDLKNAETARREEARRASEAATLAANQRGQLRAAAQETRDHAMQTYSGMEKLSYLIPIAALWALYQLSPLITLISLSARVSQNILFIGSATHLFAESFFRSAPNTDASRPLSADRVTTA